jgi:uncharacterized protein YdeI (YjbR/CyaY-like superfamily)
MIPASYESLWEYQERCKDAGSCAAVPCKGCTSPAKTKTIPKFTAEIEVNVMPASAKPELKIVSFKTPKDMEKWLAKNHDKSPGIWLRMFKKDSGKKSVNWQEAVVESLCYGWIDGQSKSYDDESWLQRFTPRRAKSIWSKKNTDHIERLTALGKMKPAGLAHVEKAKADGRWAKAYDSPASMQVPDDFMKALAKNKTAKAFFESLSKANKYAIAWRLQTAKKPETRAKRMKMILEMLKKGEKFH